ncbi:MAG: dephospho-CoA kinase [Candidatus Neomarinimicrobiota bacterium]|nr:MAG: dephospho-CoA kinase [Candidatus Neomarinimicrobiota bacterium]
MLKVGLTGGIGCGKSTASAILSELGAYIFDADKEAKHILDTNERVQSELIAEFGTDILGPDETIDRKKLARVSFQDEDHQLRLNAIVHPYIFEEIDRRFAQISSQGKYPLFVVDGALIFESGLDQHLDYIIVISSTMKHRIERALSRGTLTREEIIKRMELQWTDEDKIHSADFVIHNNSTEESLREQVEEVYRRLT